MARTKTIAAPSKDPKKESHFKELVGMLGAAGYVVRREKLRQGPGWKVVSGSCRALSSRLIFVDPRLPQDEQILFLKARISELNINDNPTAAISEAISEAPTAA